MNEWTYTHRQAIPTVDMFSVEWRYSCVTIPFPKLKRCACVCVCGWLTQKEAHSQLNWHRVLHTCNPISIWWNHFRLKLNTLVIVSGIVVFVSFVFIYFFTLEFLCDFYSPLIKSLTSPNSPCTSLWRWLWLLLYSVLVIHSNLIRIFCQIYG